MTETRIAPTVGRICHVYSPELWSGPRMGRIVGVDPDHHPDQIPRVAVAVSLDPYRDKALIERPRPGDTRSGMGTETERLYWGVEIHSPREPGERPVDGMWAEWMPFQQGQAAADLPSRVKRLEGVVGIASAGDAPPPPPPDAASAPPPPPPEDASESPGDGVEPADSETPFEPTAESPR